MIRHAIILAGGFGTRLGKLVSDVPKPMLPIGERPFLAFLLEYLQKQDVTDVILCVGYLHETIVRYFGNQFGSLQLQYSIEEKPLGTGGAIAKALEILDAQDAFVLNGDTFVGLNYQAMSALHFASGATLTIGTRHVSDVSRYGELLLQEGRVIEFREKDGAHPGLINSGVYAVSQSLFAPYEPQAAFSFERDFLRPFIGRIQPIAFLFDGYFIDIGVPEDYQRARQELSR